MARKDYQKYMKHLSIFLGCVLGLLVFLLAMRQIDEYKLQDDPVLNRLRETMTTFFSQDKVWTGKLVMLNHRTVMKDINIYRGVKSLTMNKEKVYICCKDSHGEYYSENMLMYVLAHELSHVLSESIGHTQEFHDIFEELLVELTDFGVYDPSQEIIADYCENGDNS